VSLLLLALKLSLTLANGVAVLMGRGGASLARAVAGYAGGLMVPGVHKHTERNAAPITEQSI
jgi:predicted sugar kinase